VKIPLRLGTIKISASTNLRQVEKITTALCFEVREIKRDEDEEPDYAYFTGTSPYFSALKEGEKIPLYDVAFHGADFVLSYVLRVGDNNEEKNKVAQEQIYCLPNEVIEELYLFLKRENTK